MGNKLHGVLRSLDIRLRSIISQTFSLKKRIFAFSFLLLLTVEVLYLSLQMNKLAGLMASSLLYILAFCSIKKFIEALWIFFLATFMAIQLSTYTENSSLIRIVLGIGLLLYIVTILVECETDKNQIKSVVLRLSGIAVTFIPCVYFYSKGYASNLATFMYGWDHLGAHLYLLGQTSDDVGMVYGTSYIGNNPKFLYSFMNLIIGSDASTPMRLYSFLFLEFVCSLVITMTLANALSSRKQLSVLVKVGGLFLALSFPLLGYISFLGYPTLLFASMILLLALTQIDNSNFKTQSAVFFGPAMVANIWPVLFPAFFAAAFIWLIQQHKAKKLVFPFVLVTLICSFASVSAIKNSTGIFGSSLAGNETSNELLFILLFAIPIYYTTRIRHYRKDFAALLIIFVFASGASIVFLKRSSFGEIPYYSFKLFWVGIFIVFFQFLKSTHSKNWNFRQFVFVATCLFGFGSFFLPIHFSTSTYSLFFNPETIMRWQAKASVFATLDVRSDKVIVYSGDPNDSRSAMYLSVNNKTSWPASSGLRSGPSEICDFLNKNPKFFIIVKGDISQPSCFKDPALVEGIKILN